MGTYDTRGGAPVSPRDAESSSAEIKLTGEEWQILITAAKFHAENCARNFRASDFEKASDLWRKLLPYSRAAGALIEVSGEAA